MSTLGAMLGEGRYVFYKSLYNSSNPIFREAATVASGRLNSNSVLMSGRSLDKEIQAESSSDVNGKENTSGTVNIGDKITYTLKIKNTG